MFPNMFADSLIETSWTQRLRRSWTTLTSFGLQAAVIGLLLLVPLLTTVGLPSVRTVSTPISAGRPDPGPARQPHSSPGRPAQVVPVNSTQIMMPARIPATVSVGEDPEPQPPGELCTGVCGVAGPATGGPGIPGISTMLPGERIMPTLRAQPARTFRTSSMMEGSLIRRVQPVYPGPARAVRVQGAVVLAAVISKAGTIENLRVVSGRPLLVPAAIEAVKQWRYRPYILNDEPVEVETQITVNFILGS